MFTFTKHSYYLTFITSPFDTSLLLTKVDSTAFSIKASTSVVYFSLEVNLDYSLL